MILLDWLIYILFFGTCKSICSADLKERGEVFGQIKIFKVLASERKPNRE